jgi:hypothetical protein
MNKSNIVFFILFLIVLQGIATLACFRYGLGRACPW